MATFTQSQSTRSASILTMGTLPSGTYIASSVIDLGAAIPLDETFEVECTPSATPVGNKRLLVFAKLSLDNTNFTSGPESGTTTTDETDLESLGVMTINSTGVHRKFFNLAGLPVARHVKIVIKNELGVALTSGAVYRADITGSST